jgi:hypothetical protein
MAKGLKCLVCMIWLYVTAIMKLIYGAAGQNLEQQHPSSLALLKQQQQQQQQRCC